MKKNNYLCSDCLYHQGNIKFIISPCPECIVYGGTNHPIHLKPIKKDASSDPGMENSEWKK